MNLLITYASNSGGTHLVAQQIGESLSSKQDKVTIKKAGDTKVSDFDKNDVILIGSPSWWVGDAEGRPHETIIDLLKRLEKYDLTNKNFALFGCGDRSYIHFCAAVDELEEFISAKGANKLIGSLKLDAYFFDLDRNVKTTDAWTKKLTQNLPVASIA